MVRKSKWIAHTTPDEPLESVAQRALESRLQLVWHYLPRAARHSDDVENVHQLRVATRRAMAAMQIFEPLLPPRRAVWMNKQLKRVRQAAGDARDLDVLAARLDKRNQADPDHRLADVLHCVERMRREAQRPIEKIHARLERKDFLDRERALVERTHLRSKAERLIHPTYAQAARRAVSPLVEDLFAAAESELHDYAALHAFRIHAKQLRYAMEVFAGAFDRSWREELYPLVEALQEKLGQINDHATAKGLFADWLAAPESSPMGEVLAALVAEEEAAMERTRSEFFDWWSVDKAEMLRARFKELLSPDST